MAVGDLRIFPLGCYTHFRSGNLQLFGISISVRGEIKVLLLLFFVFGRLFVLGKGGEKGDLILCGEGDL